MDILVLIIKYQIFQGKHNARVAIYTDKQTDGQRQKDKQANMNENVFTSNAANKYCTCSGRCICRSFHMLPQNVPDVMRSPGPGQHCQAHSHSSFPLKHQQQKWTVLSEMHFDNTKITKASVTLSSYSVSWSFQLTVMFHTHSKTNTATMTKLN